MKDTSLYFAYGSNINLDQMDVRCPKAVPLCTVELDGYELRFRGNSRDTGVANIEPKQGGKVYGLLWEITPECEKSLDRYEGYPFLYGKKQVNITLPGGQKIPVMAYVMQEERHLKPAMPSYPYYNGIREGFRENGIPLFSLEQALHREHAQVEKHQKKLKHKNNER